MTRHRLYIDFLIVTRHRLYIDFLIVTRHRSYILFSSVHRPVSEAVSESAKSAHSYLITRFRLLHKDGDCMLTQIGTRSQSSFETASSSQWALRKCVEEDVFSQPLLQCLCTMRRSSVSSAEVSPDCSAKIMRQRSEGVYGVHGSCGVDGFPVRMKASQASLTESCSCSA